MDKDVKEPDLSWMSFSPEALHRRTLSNGWVDFGGDRAEQLLQRQRNSESKAAEYEWREREIVEEVEEEEEDDILRERTNEEARRSRSENLGYRASFDPDSPSSAPPPPPPSGARPMRNPWNAAARHVYSFSPRSLGRGFQQRRKRWIESLEEDNVIQLPRTKLNPRLQFVLSWLLGSCLVALLIAGILLYLSLAAAVRPPRSCEVDKVVLNFTAQRIRLKGGRFISFREQGVAAERARHTVLVVHDLVSSRLAGIPGINESLLEEHGVRLISYDRPGYGQSDPHPDRNYNSSAQDMADIADALRMGEKFWVFGFGIGGPHVWAAINYIPERLAGVALFAPSGNFYSQNMTAEEVSGTWGVLSVRQKWMYSIARHFPALLPSLLQKTLVNDNPNPLQAFPATLGSKDQGLMEQPDALKFWKEDAREAVQQRCAFPMAQEIILLVDNWGFSLADMHFQERTVKSFLKQVVGLFQAKEKPRIYSGPIHIWQGSSDQHVPVTMNEFARRMVYYNDFPKGNVSPLTFHLLEGEGHLSWFWFCDVCHRTMFNTLFQQEKVVIAGVDPRGFSSEEYEAILAAFGGPKQTVDKLGNEATENSHNIFSSSKDIDEDRYDYEWYSKKDSQEMGEASTGMQVYVPESCQATGDMSTSDSDRRWWPRRNQVGMWRSQR